MSKNRTLRTDVFGRDGVRYVAGTAESDIPSSAEITNPKAWSDYVDPNGAPVGNDDTVEIPPKAGPGSGKEAWLAYAGAQGVEVHPDDTKAEIIEALEAAGVPTE